MPRTGKAFWLCPVLRPSGSLLRALHGTKVVSTTLQLHRAAAIELSWGLARPTSGSERRQIKLPAKLPLVSREWKSGSNSSYNCTPFLHSLLTKCKQSKRGRAGSQPWLTVRGAVREKLQAFRLFLQQGNSSQHGSLPCLIR